MNLRLAYISNYTDCKRQTVQIILTTVMCNGKQKQEQSYVF